MKQNKGKIGIKEYVALISLSVGAKLSDDTPSIIFETSRNAGWISVILIAILSLIPIIALLRVFSVHKEKNLHEVIIHLFGKILGNFISIILLIGGTAAVIIDSGVYVDIIDTMYFPMTPTIVIYAILMFVCGYGAKRGIEQIGSASWLLFPYIKVTLLIAIIFTFMEGNKGYIFPIWGEGLLETAKTSAKYVSIYADFLFLGLIAPLVTSFKDLKKGTFLSLFIVTLEISIPLVAFVMLFDYTTAEMLNYPFHEMIRYIHIGFMANVETFFFPFWLVATFIRFSFYLYLVATLLGGILKIKEFEYLIPLLTAIILLIGIIPENPSITLYSMRKIILGLLTPAFMTLPLTMWFLAKIRGDFKNETTKDFN
ncbi:MAG TPA: hypothetical protein DCR24_11375 [Bacillus bacterium]|nr:hypothetical protein [Bacillus sp. (in: firmicutes)]